MDASGDHPIETVGLNAATAPVHTPGVTVVGHPFSQVGMGEQMRAGFRAVRAAGIPAALHDVFRYAPRQDPDIRSLVLPDEADGLPEGGIRICHFNGDEIGPVLEALSKKGAGFENGYNIIVPAWELPRYPSVWRDGLLLFDEIWAMSRFVKAAIESIGLTAHHVGQSVEADYGNHLPRRFFAIRESSFVLLSAFDMSSYVARKNPFAAIDLFKRFRQKRPFDDVQLVLKMRAGEQDASESVFPRVGDLPKGTVVIRENYPSYAARSLVGCCDCLVSLHRSEGFGRSMGEAMFLGRLALATGWSGNCDYMTPDNSLFVRHAMVDVREGDYPHSAGQQWAEPDVDHALHLLLKALDDPAWMRRLRQNGRLDARRLLSNRAVGLRMLARLEAVCAGSGWAAP